MKFVLHLLLSMVLLSGGLAPAYCQRGGGFIRGGGGKGHVGKSRSQQRMGRKGKHRSYRTKQAGADISRQYNQGRRDISDIGNRVADRVQRADYQSSRNHITWHEAARAELYTPHEKPISAMYAEDIFMGKISTFLSEIQKYASDIYKRLPELDFSNDLVIKYLAYDKMPSISIDYAVMEKSDKIALVELLSDWNDLGSLQSLYNVKEKDSNGNVLTGKVVVDKVKNSFIYSQKEIVAVSGLEDIILVETEDAIMACKKTESQNVKRLYEKLKAQSSDTTKLHKTVYRPWGYFTCMNSGKGYLTKTICVMPGEKLSVQSHEHRSEHWVVLEGRALVLKDDKQYNIDAGGSIDIPIGVKHSLQNPYDTELKIIEVQKGDYLSEDDIIRYEDCYGRV